MVASRAASTFQLKTRARLAHSLADDDDDDDDDDAADDDDDDDDACDV